VRFYDPIGARYGLPTFPFRLAPDGYATRRQLRARGLRPAGQPVAAQLLWRSRKVRGEVRCAYLYRLDLARLRARCRLRDSQLPRNLPALSRHRGNGRLI
jgi:hypothetical protein